MVSFSPPCSHTVSLGTRDHPGVLVRIALVVSRRGSNIESLAVSPGAVEGFARMTIVSRGDPNNADQILKQLAKLVDVVFVTDHRGDSPVEAEIALIKLRCTGDARQRALATAARHGALVVADETERVILTGHGTKQSIDDLLDALAEHELEELVRTGRIVMDRGASQFAHLLGGARSA